MKHYTAYALNPKEGFLHLTVMFHLKTEMPEFKILETAIYDCIFDDESK